MTEILVYEIPYPSPQDLYKLAVKKYVIEIFRIVI